MPIRILLVDDSEVVRFLFTKSLERDASLIVVGSAGNGLEAIEKARQLLPDIVILDIEMPVMDGLTALPEILRVSPRSKVFVIAGDSPNSANPVMESLRLGASEFMLKPGLAGAANPQEFNADLRNKIKALITPQAHAPDAELARAPVAPLPADSAPGTAKQLAPVTALPRPFAMPVAVPSVTPPKPMALQPARRNEVLAIAIASSTGGPEALMRFFSDLDGSLNHLPIFITQHMPPLFTTALAENIARHGKRTCREAVDFEKVQPGVVYVAPGGNHMLVHTIAGAPHIRLTQDSPVNSCRPSADPMFASISHVYGRNTLALVLTGIGADGCSGAHTIFTRGGSIIAQDKLTSVVYGMPRSVAEAGICEAIVGIDAMANTVIHRCGARYA